MFSSCDNIYTCLVLNIQLNDPGTWWILICELPFVDMTYAFCNLFFHNVLLAASAQDIHVHGLIAEHTCKYHIATQTHREFANSDHTQNQCV